MSEEQEEQRSVFGAVRDNRCRASDLLIESLFGGELAGVVVADEAGEPLADEEEVDEAERVKGSLRLGNR